MPTIAAPAMSSQSISIVELIGKCASRPCRSRRSWQHSGSVAGDVRPLHERLRRVCSATCVKAADEDGDDVDGHGDARPRRSMRKRVRQHDERHGQQHPAVPERRVEQRDFRRSAGARAAVRRPLSPGRLSVAPRRRRRGARRTRASTRPANASVTIRDDDGVSGSFISRLIAGGHLRVSIDLGRIGSGMATGLIVRLANRASAA